jgi:chromosomal replication initiator protein
LSIKEDKEIVDDLKKVICFYFKISEQEMISECRENECKFARYFYCLFTRALYGTSMRLIGIEIGERDNERDHATVLHGINRLIDYLSTGDKMVTKYYQDLIEEAGLNGFDFIRIRKFVADKIIERMKQK